MRLGSGRTATLATTLIVLIAACGAIAAKPWVAAPVDPKVAALHAREQRAQEAAAAAKRIVDQKWAKYRANLAARRRQIAAAERRRAAELAEYRRKLAIAQARRPRIVRTVVAGSGGTGGGRWSPASGGSTSGGSRSSPAPSSSGGGGVVAPPVISAPPVTSTRTS